MSKISGGPQVSRSSAVDAESDVYTVLLCIAFLTLLAATIYVGYRAMTLFGTILPPGGG